MGGNSDKYETFVLPSCSELVGMLVMIWAWVQVMEVLKIENKQNGLFGLNFAKKKNSDSAEKEKESSFNN